MTKAHPLSVSSRLKKIEPNNTPEVDDSTEIEVEILDKRG